MKEHILQLAKEGSIILDRDDIVEKNHVSSQTRELCILMLGNLEPDILLEPGLLNFNIQKVFPSYLPR